MATEVTGTSVSTDTFRLAVSAPPLTPTSPGIPGTIAWDENFIYTCIAPSLWARTGYSVAW
jgi:hypothetical protein